MKIGLGTVQFGLPYGVTNDAGATPVVEARRILEVAARQEIAVLDTAPLYGEAETVLGAALPPGHRFDIVTKTPAFGGRVTAADAGVVIETFRASLASLRAKRIYALLIHHAEDLLAPGGEYLLAAASELRGQGYVKKIGVSVYTAEEIDAVMARHRIDVIQVPVSALDQRLVACGHLDALKRAGVEVHARSLFLQGLLLVSPERVPSNLQGLRPAIERFHAFVAEHGMSPAQGALAFAASTCGIDVALVGVNNSSQLEDICRSRQWSIPDEQFRSFAVSDASLLDPRRWSAQASQPVT